MEEDKITTIKLRESTKDRLKIYKRAYRTYEQAIIKLMDFFENPPISKK